MDLPPMAGQRLLRMYYGPQFIARDFKTFVREVGLEHVRTSPCYPQSNGKKERFYQSLKSEALRDPRPPSPSRTPAGWWTASSPTTMASVPTPPSATSPPSTCWPDELGRSMLDAIENSNRPGNSGASHASRTPHERIRRSYLKHARNSAFR